MRILLVEDNPVTAHEIATEIEYEGFHCDTAQNTSEALEFLRRGPYRIAMLDHYLQGETTIFLASHLRLRHPETLIVSITGSALYANGYGLDRLGADFLFRKPFAIRDLIEIAKYLDATSERPADAEPRMDHAAPMRRSSRMLGG